jgi:type IV pilus secretin PilQ/predicted competence protein
MKLFGLLSTTACLLVLGTAILGCAQLQSTLKREPVAKTESKPTLTRQKNLADKSKPTLTKQKNLADKSKPTLTNQKSLAQKPANPTYPVRQASYDAEYTEPATVVGSQGGSQSQAQTSPPEVVPLPNAAMPVEPPVAAPNAPLPAVGNKLITMHVDDLEIRKALEILSRQANLSILVSPGVKGTVTLDLRDKTADEVLQAIAQLCRLSVRRENDIVFVRSETELMEGESELPLRIYHLNYVKSADVLSMVKPLLSKKGTISASPDSQVGIPADANKAGGNDLAGGETVIVQDFESVLRAIDRVVAQIDVQPAQILIEAVIVSVTLDKDQDLGINFGLLDSTQNALGLMGSGALVNSAAGFTPASVIGDVANKVTNEIDQSTTSGTDPTKTTNSVKYNSKTSTTGLMRNGWTSDDNGVKIGWTGRKTTGFIKALEGFGETKVLACPRLLVVNKQRAELQLGERLGYKTLTQTQTSTVEKVDFMDTGTLLRLRPFISSDGMIRMEIHPERSSGELNKDNVPQTHGAQVTSNVLVPDGTTIVIGGLMDHEFQTTYEGVPFLCRLPWIGSLFRETNTVVKKRELIVILTPHIWRPECPQGLNHPGSPRSLGLESTIRVPPKGLGKDEPSLYELPASCPSIPTLQEVPASPPPKPLPVAPMPERR